MVKKIETQKPIVLEPNQIEEFELVKITPNVLTTFNNNQKVNTKYDFYNADMDISFSKYAPTDAKVIYPGSNLGKMYAQNEGKEPEVGDTFEFIVTSNGWQIA